VIGFAARLGLRILQRLGIRNVYVRRLLWVLAIARWLRKRRHNSTQVVRLRNGESLVISIDESEARFS
jgi:hypothetical protein